MFSLFQIGKSIIRTPDIAAISTLASKFAPKSRLPSPSSIFPGATTLSPSRPFSASFPPRAEVNFQPTTSKTQSFFKEFSNEFGKQIVINAPVFTLMTYLSGPDELPTDIRPNSSQSTQHQLVKI